MSRRQWSKFYDSDYLADVKLQQISVHERGVLHILWALMQSQTDEPGRMIIGGIIYTSSDIHRVVKRYSPADGCTKNVCITRWVNRLVTVGILAEEEDGTICSPRIVRDAEAYEQQRAYGQRGAAAQGKRLYNEGGQPPRATTKGGPRPTPRIESEAESEAEQTPRGNGSDSEPRLPDPEAEYRERRRRMDLEHDTFLVPETLRLNRLSPEGLQDFYASLSLEEILRREGQGKTMAHLAAFEIARRRARKQATESQPLTPAESGR